MGEHKSENEVGENNRCWKGGVSNENKRIRNSKKAKDWRKAVFERDNYTCKLCGKRGGILNADHIKPFAYFPELRFDVDNGRTLCAPCHKTTETYGANVHKIYGKKDNKESRKK